MNIFFLSNNRKHKPSLERRKSRQLFKLSQVQNKKNAYRKRRTTKKKNIGKDLKKIRTEKNKKKFKNKKRQKKNTLKTN